MGNITFGSFIAEKRKAHKFNLRDTAKHLNIAYGYLCDIEQSRRPAPTGDFVERISAFLNLDKSEHELLLDLAAKSRNTVSADLPDYIMEKDIVRAALRVAKVLLVDADPQGDLTTCLGWQDTDSLTHTLANKLLAVMREEQQDPLVGMLNHKEKVDLVPSNLELALTEMSLVTAMNRERIMKSYLDQVKDKYDYILIDCMPSLGMITLNALTAADRVIIPVQAQYLPAKGMTQLLATIAKVKKHTNPNLHIDGVLLTLVDGRTNLAKSTVETLRNHFGSYIKIYKTSIPIAVKAAEVSSKGKSIYAYEPNSIVSKAYADFTRDRII